MSKDEIMNIVISELNKKGITNKFILAGILSVIDEETGFEIRSENLNYTSPDRILEVWPSRFDSTYDTLPYVGNPELLANYVYGGIIGNNDYGDGWAYRGRGLNQLTGKGNYAHTGQRIGIDLVSNPDKANEPSTAAKIVADYFYDHFNNSNGKLFSVYGAKNANDFKDLNTATRAAVNANAGWGANIDNLPRTSIALKNAPKFLSFVENKKTVNTKLIVISFSLLILVFILFKFSPLPINFKIILTVFLIIMSYLLYQHL